MALRTFFVLSELSSMNIHDIQDSSGRGRLTSLYHFIPLHRRLGIKLDYYCRELTFAQLDHCIIYTFNLSQMLK